MSFRDSAGITHSVDVTAESLFEAAASALCVFRKNNWLDPMSGATRLEVEVRVTCRVPSDQSLLENGADRTG